MSENTNYPKSNSSQFCKNIFEELKREGSTCKEVLMCLFQNFLKLINGEIPINDLIKRSELASDYKTSTFFMNVYYKHLVNNGINPNAGDILPYIYIDKSDEYNRYGESMEHPDLFNSNEDKINILIYLEELDGNHFDDIFANKFDSSSLSEIVYVRKNRRLKKKQNSLMEPSKFLYDLYDDNSKVENSTQYITDYINELYGSISNID